MRGKVVYEDSNRKVTKVELKSEAHPNGAVRFSKCDHKRCRKEAHYYIRLTDIPGWINHVCRKHMKTMTDKDVRDVESKAALSGSFNKIWANIMSKR